MQARQLDPHLRAERGIEVGERLVEEEDVGGTGNRAADGDALLLAAGKLLRLLVEMLGDAEDLRGPLHRRIDFGARPARHLQPEAHVLGDVHVRIEGVVLEDHGDAAVGRLELGDVALVDDDPPGGDRLEPGNDAQKRGLAAARRSDHDDELAALDGEAHVADRAEAAVVLGDVVDGEAMHDGVTGVGWAKRSVPTRLCPEKAARALRERVGTLSLYPPYARPRAVISPTPPGCGRSISARRRRSSRSGRWRSTARPSPPASRR